ncbi:MAG: DNA cytosine methyltransferase [Lachnospiraceae bacterium]|nr:DNA cytosine methyltransferase [Lachnospiraceae bacterium]
MEQNKNKLTLGSLFSGSGGFELAGTLAGIKPVFNSEVEPFPIAVTCKRFPDVKHYGDVSALNGADLEPVDIITFGSPCTDLSIAGKRAGLDGEHSGLFHEAIRIIKEMREKTNGQYPRYAVWENVFGAFSSHKGEDFKAVLEAFIRVAEPAAAPVPLPEKGSWPYADVLLGDRWSVAYRTLDAQYWGTPQRRRRIYLVADFRGRSAGEVLFKSEGLSGYTPQSQRSWQGAAGDFTQGAGAAGGGNGEGEQREQLILEDQGGSRIDVGTDITSTLRAETHGHPPCVMDGAAGFCTEHSANARSIGYEEERSPTLRAGVVPAVVPLENHPADSRIRIEEDGKIQTLSGRMGTGGNNVPLLMEDQTKALRMRAGKDGGGKGALIQNGVSGTLGCSNDQAVFVPEQESCYWDGGQVVGTLTDKNARGVQRMPDKQNFNCVLEREQTDEPQQTVFGISSFQSHAMLSDNPHAGIYEAETTRTLDAAGGNPGCNQGGVCVVEQEKCYDIRQTSDGTKVSRCHCYETDTARTLGTTFPNPAGNHGGVAVVRGESEEPVAFTQNQRDEVRDLGNKSGSLQAQPGAKQQTYVLQGNMIGRDDKNGPQGCGVSEDVCYTLTDVDRHAVAAPDSDCTPADTVYAMTTGCFTHVEEEVSPTLMARDYKDPTTVAPVPKDAPVKEIEPHYTVRRLTPTECARLQGFPDWWCHDLGNPDPTDEEVAFWMDVWETHRKVVTHASKPKTEKQVRKWLADPYSDSAEYKLWGNGIQLNCAFFVLSGIAWAAGKEE